MLILCGVKCAVNVRCQVASLVSTLPVRDLLTSRLELPGNDRHKYIFMIQQNIEFQALNEPGGQVVVLERGRDTPSKKIKIVFLTKKSFKNNCEHLLTCFPQSVW